MQEQPWERPAQFYGIMVGFAFMLPDAELSLIFLPIPIKAKFFVPIIASTIAFGIIPII